MAKGVSHRNLAERLAEVTPVTHRSSTECRRGSMMMSASSSSSSLSATSAAKREPVNHDAAEVSDDEA